MGLTGIPFIDNALGVGPAQQAKSQQAQQNYAQGITAQSLQNAQQIQQQELANMFARFQQFMQANPNPVNTWGAIQGPPQVGGTIGNGGQQMPSFMPQPFAPQQGQQAAQQGQASPQNLTSLLQSLYPGSSMPSMPGQPAQASQFPIASGLRFF